MTDPNHIAEARKKVSRPQVREAFLRNGAVIPADRDDLPDYVYEAAFELLEMAAPAVQGEPDVSALVEALTMARETIASALRANAPDYFTTDADIARHVVIQRIDTALAAYRKGGE